MVRLGFLGLSLVYVAGCNDFDQKFGCESDPDCFEGRSCVSGLCVKGCGANECPDALCNPLEGCQLGVNGDLCVDRNNCAGNRRCGPMMECQAGVAGDLCEVQDHCSAGHYCGTDNQCHLGANGDPCMTAPQCLSGICGPTNRCQDGAAGDSCTSATDCQGGLSCGTGGTCVGCSGTPRACGSLSVLACTSTMGCSLRDVCTGIPPFCAFQQDQRGCELILGCAWRGALCEGLPTPCIGFGGRSSCETQPECKWESTCGGTAVVCEELQGAACPIQPGCGLN